MQVISIMSAIIETSSSWLTEDTADARTNNWFLVSGIWKIPAIILVYLFCIYIGLPIYMKNRKPYSLKHVVMIYNASQIIACSLLCYNTVTSGWTTHYTLGCQPVDYSNDKMALQMATCVWWNLILKLTDLIETYFYVLRKKMDQVSLLHVHHHAIVVYIAWLTCKYSPGGMLTFTIVVNSFIHALMYSYYLLASFGPEMQKRLRFIKSKLTALQIIQLIVLLIHSLQAFPPSCHLIPIAKVFYGIYVGNLIIMICLFLNFFVKSYIKKKKDV